MNSVSSSKWANRRDKRASPIPSTGVHMIKDHRFLHSPRARQQTAILGQKTQTTASISPILAKLITHLARKRFLTRDACAAQKIDRRRIFVRGQRGYTPPASRYCSRSTPVSPPSPAFGPNTRPKVERRTRGKIYRSFPQRWRERLRYGCKSTTCSVHV